MFAALTVDKPRQGIRGRLYELTHEPEIDIKQVRLKNAPSFYVVRARLYKGEVPWSAVCEKCAGLSKRMLLPRGLELKEGCGVKRFVPRILPERLLFGYTIKLLKRLSLPATRTSVTVVDENGCCVDMIDEICPYAYRITVVTSCLEQYHGAARRLLSRWGVSLIIRERLSKSECSSTLIMSSDPAIVDGGFSGVLVTLGQPGPKAAAVACPALVRLFEPYLGMLPSSIDPFDFACALYELCSVEDMQQVELLER